jgi:hypothetical protein
VTNDRGVCNSQVYDKHMGSAVKVMHFGPFSRLPHEELSSIGWSDPE